MRSVRFIKNPVGKYNLSYEVGEVVSLSDSLTMDLIADGYAVATDEEPVTIPDNTEAPEVKKAKKPKK